MLRYIHIHSGHLLMQHSLQLLHRDQCWISCNISRRWSGNIGIGIGFGTGLCLCRITQQIIICANVDLLLGVAVRHLATRIIWENILKTMYEWHKKPFHLYVLDHGLHITLHMHTLLQITKQKVHKGMLIFSKNLRNASMIYVIWFLSLT